ncbi:hypothetical protein MKW92_036749, partial [Papaver armeniacum]
VSKLNTEEVKVLIKHLNSTGRHFSPPASDETLLEEGDILQMRIAKLEPLRNSADDPRIRLLN